MFSNDFQRTPEAAAYLARVGERGAHGKTVAQVRQKASAAIREAICEGENVTLTDWCAGVATTPGGRRPQPPGPGHP